MKKIPAFYGLCSQFLSKASPLFEYTVNKNNKSKHNFINNLSATCFGFVIRPQAEYTIVVGTIHALQCRVYIYVGIAILVKFGIGGCALDSRLPLLYSCINGILKHNGDALLKNGKRQSSAHPLILNLRRRLCNCNANIYVNTYGIVIYIQFLQQLCIQPEDELQSRNMSLLINY